MKKLIGIILAVCMLFTVAAAAQVTGSANPAEDGSMKIIVTYGNIPAGAQATMLAYEVTGVADASATTDYKNQTDTPIVGIDQEPVDNAFEVKLADTFMDSIPAGGSRLIVVKVGGTDMDPMSWLVTFTKAETPGEGGGEDEGIEITVQYGDVNGDTYINAVDAALILQKGVGTLPEGFKDQEQRAIPDTVGDVNGDTYVNAVDAALVLQKGVGTLPEGFKDQSNNPLTTHTYTYVAPQA